MPDSSNMDEFGGKLDFFSFSFRMAPRRRGLRLRAVS